MDLSDLQRYCLLILELEVDQLYVVLAALGILALAFSCDSIPTYSAFLQTSRRSGMSRTCRTCNYCNSCDPLLTLVEGVYAPNFAVDDSLEASGTLVFSIKAVISRISIWQKALSGELVKHSTRLSTASLRSEKFQALVIMKEMRSESKSL